MAQTVLGHAVSRREDPAHLTGEARYLDDLVLEGALHVAFVRSPHAHALLRGVDVRAAAQQPGVVGVFTAADLDLRPSPAMGNEKLSRPQIATDRVRYVGEITAAVVAESRASAVDGAEFVVCDYEPLPAVTDPVAALADGAPLLFPDHGSNVVADREPRDDASYFDGADVVVSERLRISRVAPVTMEPNGCVAIPETGGLTVWASTQSVFGVKGEIASQLGLDASAVRVRAPSIGGGFGAKGGTYPEQVIVAALAHRLQRPVRYAETRTENLLQMTHGRSQILDVQAGARRDGSIVALRVRTIGDAGAYANRAFVPMVTRTMASGPYRIPKIDVRITIVVTNTTPTGPYRGAGRPEAAAMLERTMDLIAAELGLDPADVRRVNFIPPDAFPYETPTRATYDSGEYERALDLALEMADYPALRAEQRARRERRDRVQLGIGIASYVEVSGGGSEFGSVGIEPDGRVTVVTGSVPHGQGHETAWAQIVSSVLGVDIDDVRVVHSDTAHVPRGTGTFGSRSLQVGGSAVHGAATSVLDRAKKLVAQMLEAAEEDIVVHDGGRLGVAGSPAAAVSWRDIAKHARDLDAGATLNAELDFAQQGTFPFGSHVAVVELDTETGEVRLARLVAVDDCGRIVNPMLVEGQVHGGVAQGAAQTLFEHVAFDESGNPLTATLATYAMPSAAELPSFETAHTQTPSPNNPLGAKGIGESGTTGAMASTWNAVVDALAPSGLRHFDMPATPERVWRAWSPRPSR